MTITATHVVSDEGTIVVFSGQDNQGNTVRFGVDHRMAVVLVERIAYEGEAVCHVEPWQLV